MRHAFVPMTNGSPRCAKCLRMLDCAPHLPIAPPSMYPVQVIATDTSRWPGIRSRAAALLAASSSSPAASRAAR